MGRLFWKFFFAFQAALLVAGVGVGFTVSLFHDRQLAEPGVGGSWPPPPPWASEPPPPPGVWSPRAGGDPPPVRRGPPPPVLPILAALLGSLVASALLAWYFARPIRHLRWALGEIAEGRFDTRVQQLMDGRRDELADLGRDVDLMAQKLDALVTTQRRLLHDVSHELRSPLARIQAAIGLGRQDAAKLEATMERVERETVRLDALVGQLLTLARLDAGTGTEAIVELDVVELLADIAHDARFEARAANRDLEFAGDAGFVIHGRDEILHRAFENVLRNAVKYTASATTVTVRAELPTPERLCVAVCDHGPGVPPSKLAAIFEPFHRVADNDQDGFGLGLAIARRAIEAHGGTIRAENRVGSGLCIVIELPKR
ncbi:MAG: HAMP domain-containing protein [Rhodocyclales bacterium]|nr:HAMP domain-containing protein [Rhodocyclales bacterium]